MRTGSHHKFYVYILTNKVKTVLYTGVTNNLPARLYQHQTNETNNYNGFTRRYKCYYLVYYEGFQYIDKAIAREKQIKGITRARKNALIESVNPDWRFLNDEI